MKKYIDRFYELSDDTREDITTISMFGIGLTLYGVISLML